MLVAGARPNFMKISPLIRAIYAFNEVNGDVISSFFVHTGQHYDSNMSDAFFEDFGLPDPDINLEIGSGSHGKQTGRVLIEFEKVLFREEPDLLIVVGDINSTLACALAAVKLHIPVAHIESGLRSFDRRMPEEINRIVTDALSDYLFTPSQDADENLLKEGVSQEKIHLVGDIMVDNLLFNLERAKKTNILEKLNLKQSNSVEKYEPINDYSLLTLHRPSNVDNKESFTRIVQGLLQVSSKIPVIFPIHPRTQKQIKILGLESDFIFYPSHHLRLEDYYSRCAFKRKIHCFDPVGYFDFLNLMANSKFVLTDSGGIQEETTVLDIPCITLRDTTERPITLTEGTNVLVGNDSKKILEEVLKILDGGRKKGSCPLLWDGHTAERIVKILVEKK